MEVTIFAILTTIFFVGVSVSMINNRSKNGLLITICVYFIFLMLGIGSILKNHALLLFSSSLGMLAFFLTPVYLEFIERTSAGQKTSSNNFAKRYNLKYTYDVPDYISDEILENYGDLDPLNNNSCFRDKSAFDGIFANEKPYSVTYDSAITCQIDELKFHLIERNLNYKYHESRKHRHNIGPKFYTLSDFICIIESETSVNIPNFILRDRIPFIDSMKYCLEFFDAKYIDLKNDRLFSSRYILETSDSKKVRDYFSLNIRNAFSNNKIKDVTMKTVNNRLLIRFPRRISLDEYRAIFNVGCSFFKKEIDIFNKKNMDRVLKSDNDDEEEGSIWDYFRDERGNLGIPPFLGGLIIFIMSLVIIALVGKYL